MEVLVAEDEALARESISHVLRSRDDITRVHCVEDGTQAINFLKENDVDVIFLDIQMPGCSGIEVARQLAPNQHVIFTTAYDHYAVKAFELNAIDYILKPFSDKRLFEALDKVSSKTSKVSDIDYDHLSDLIKQTADASLPSNNQRLVMRESKKVKLFDYNDIAYIKGAGNYVEVVFTNGKAQLFRETLGHIEAQLSNTIFVRIHKSTIVRSDLISELTSSGKGDYKVVLKEGGELTLSRRYKNKLFPLIDES